VLSAARFLWLLFVLGCSCIPFCSLHNALIALSLLPRKVRFCKKKKKKGLDLPSCRALATWPQTTTTHSR
jgi:hypothetical protein